MGNNKLIKQKLATYNIRHWELADTLNISEATLCRKLRHELPEAEADQILKTIEEMAKNETFI